MLHIIPVQSKSEQRTLAESFGECFDERAFAYLAVEEDETLQTPLGFMQFTLGDECAEVLCLRETHGVDDTEAMLILARAAFSFIHRVGIAAVIANKNALDPRLAAALSLEDTGGTWRLDLDRYFALPCEARQHRNTEAAQ